MSSVHGSAEEHQICRRGGISDRCFIAPSRKLRTVVFSECRRINRRPAFSAERLPASRAAVCNFHIDFGVAVQQAENLDLRRDAGSKRRPGEALAVGAMTDRCHLWLDVCRVSDRATMASAVDLHEKPHAPRRAGYAHAPSFCLRRDSCARLPTSGWPRPAVSRAERRKLPLCANSGHTRTAWRTGQIDPERAFTIGAMNGR
jgi:hypothetical protein